jgi:hypothetical protein
MVRSGCAKVVSSPASAWTRNGNGFRNDLFITARLPVLFSAEELEKKVQPAEPGRKSLNALDHFAQLGHLESVGRQHSSPGSLNLEICLLDCLSWHRTEG